MTGKLGFKLLSGWAGEGKVGLEDFFVENWREVVFGRQSGEDGVSVDRVLALAGDVGQTTADGVSAAAEGAFGSGGEEVGAVHGGGIVRVESGAGKAGEGVDCFFVGVVVVVVVVVGLGRARRLFRFVRAVMHMSSGMKHHFHDGDHEDGSQRDGPRHSGVLLRPKAVEALVAERDESGRQEMDESSGDQDSGTEMADGEEEYGRETNHWKAGHQDGKGAGQERNAKDDGEGGSVKGSIVDCFVGNTTFGTS